MARSRGDDLSRAKRTRAGATWVVTGLAVLCLLLLTIFIAQNGQHVRVHFLGADGSVSLAVALLAAAIAGALVVLLVGSIRILQLRLAARRHARADRRLEASAATPAHEPQPVEPEGDSDTTRP